MKSVWKVIAGITVALLLTGAQGPAQLDAPRLVSISAVPVYADDDKDKMESLNVTAKFSVLYLLPDGKSKRRRIVTVELDLVEAGKQTVEVGTPPVLYENDEIAAGIVAAVWKKYFENNPRELPVRRALRVPATTATTP